jgi:branched-chain amino acid transport system permease protein
MWAKRFVVALILLAAIYGLGALLEDNVIEYVVRIILFCGINGIVAVGLNLINGTTGQFSIGHAGFMAVGAYTTAFTAIHLENAFFSAQVGQLGFGAVALVFTLSLLAGALLAGLSGLVVGVPSLRLRGDYLAIVTLGFGEILRLLFNNARFLGGATGYSGERPLGLPIYTNFFWVFSWALLVISLLGNLTHSSYGRALRAIRDDEIAAEASGIPTTRFKVLAFVISAAAAGIGGGLFAHLQSTIRPDDFRFDRSIDMIVMIIVGGLGSVTGAVTGAVFVGVTLELTRDLQQYRLVVYALTLILLMLFRPQGMLGHR